MSTYEFVSVSGETVDNYKIINQYPYDWNDNYGAYFYRFNTGSGYEYRSVEGDSRYAYTALTSMPDDWNENYSSYYCIEDGEWKSVEAVQVRDEDVAPTFRLNKYYRRNTVTSAPSFAQGEYYYNDPVTNAPDFNHGTYYRAEAILLVPKYLYGNTFLAVTDNYAGMVEAGISQLMELRASQSQELTLDGFDVEIGDVVGGEDSITGYSMCEPVTNIIVRIDQYGITYEYYVGGKE